MKMAAEIYKPRKVKDHGQLQKLRERRGIDSPLRPLERVVLQADEQRQEDVGQRKNKSCSERGAPLGYWHTGVYWCILWYQGQSGAVTANGDVRIGRNQPAQGVYAMRSSLDLIH